MIDPQEEEQQLLLSISNGDAAALTRLYDRYEKTVYAFAFRFVGDAMLAEEIVQELFMRIWNHADRYDIGQGKVSTWMFAITRNIAIDQLRKRHNRTAAQTTDTKPLESLVDRDGTPEEQYDKKWVGEKVKNAIEQLNDDQRQVLDLIYYQGYTHQEVSQNKGIPLGTVKSRIRLAMKQLKNRLGDLERRETRYDQAYK
ncbi:sigma-70 family RNA polymerase sigma factor [Paenibacillus sp. PL2-23]|uniref:RNA polymerase sigma factor n=1 Tax=Paenibacillus sp. PL2-23 TaxID=2100729 RepID=UPI0030FA7299